MGNIVKQQPQETKWLKMLAGGETKMSVFPTWKNLAEKVHFLLEVSMRELLVSWLHEILAGVEEVLWRQHGEDTGELWERVRAGQRATGRERADLDGVEATVLPG